MEKEEWEKEFDKRFPVPCPPKHVVKDFIRSSQINLLKAMLESLPRKPDHKHPLMNAWYDQGFDDCLSQIRNIINEAIGN